MLTRSITRLLPFLLAAIHATGVLGQPYPTKPVRIITSEPGGGTDFATRLIAQGLAGPLGQNVIVDNRGSAFTAGIVAKAPPDGYTLLLGNTPLWIRPLLEAMPYDPIGDFAPISMLTRSPTVLVAHPALPVKSVKDLIAVAKAKPGELNYGSSGSGTSSHLAMELFKFMASVNIVRINYKGASLSLIALVGGEVQMLFSTTGSVSPHVKSGRVRALAVSSLEPSLLVPDLPTVAASGLPGYEQVSIYGMFAPAKTPDAVIKRLNQEVVRVLGRPDVKEKFFNEGVETVGSTPEQLTAKIKSEVARMGKVIKAAGIRAE